jgi:hypothetical protein
MRPSILPDALPPREEICALHGLPVALFRWASESSASAGSHRSAHRQTAHQRRQSIGRVAHPLTGRILGFFGRICGCPIPLRFSGKGGVFGSSLPLFAPLLSLRACGSVLGTGTGQPLPPFANPAKSGAPARTKTKLRSNLPEWYHPHRSAVNCENHGDEAEKHGPPAPQHQLMQTGSGYEVT